MTSPDVASLSSALSFWECVSYLATATVFVGVVGEYINDFTHWFPRARRNKRLAKGSTLILIVGLAVELVGLVKTSRLSGLEIARLNSDTARARLEVAQLRERRFTVNQRHRLAAMLAPFADTGVHIIVALPEKAPHEDKAFAHQLAGVLTKAKWPFTLQVFGTARHTSKMLGGVCRHTRGIGLSLTTDRIEFAGSALDAFDPIVLNPARALMSGLEGAGLEAGITMYGFAASGLGRNAERRIQIAICPRF